MIKQKIKSEFYNEAQKVYKYARGCLYEESLIVVAFL